MLKLAHDSGLDGTWESVRPVRGLDYISTGRECVRAFRDIQHHIYNIAILSPLLQSCAECQLRSRPLKSDRVPITPITRADLPFQVVNMDCIGPLDPPSPQGHKYCLCVVDSCTRWPAVYALKNLTSKTVCDSLIEHGTHGQ